MYINEFIIPTTWHGLSAMAANHNGRNSHTAACKPSPSQQGAPTFSWGSAMFTPLLKPLPISRNANIHSIQLDHHSHPNPATNRQNGDPHSDTALAIRQRGRALAELQQPLSHPRRLEQSLRRSELNGTEWLLIEFRWMASRELLAQSAWKEKPGRG